MRVDIAFLITVLCAVFFYVPMQSVQSTIFSFSDIESYFAQHSEVEGKIIKGLQLEGVQDEHLSEMLYLAEPEANLTSVWLQHVWQLINAKQLYTVKHVQLFVDSHGVDLIIECAKQPVVGSVSVHGYFVGKQQYKNLYTQQPGNPFEEKLHRHSMESIVQYVHDQGYLQAQVDDTLTFSKDGSMVDIAIKISRGKQYKLGSIHLNFLQVQNLSKEYQRWLRSKISGMFRRNSWLTQHYSRAYIEQVEKKVSQFLKHKGFVKSEVTSHKAINAAAKVVDITLDISLERKKELVFMGNRFFSSQHLKDVILLYGDAFWNFPHALIVDEIEQLYHQKGFWEIQVQIREEKDRVFCVINEGKRVKVQNVICKDSHVLPGKDIQSIFGKVQGAFFSKDIFDTALQELLQAYQNYGYWQAAVIKQDFIAAGNSSTNIYVTIDEGPELVADKIQVSGFHVDLQDFPGIAQLQKEEKLVVARPLLQEQKAWLKKNGMPPDSQGSIEYTLDQKDGATILHWKMRSIDEDVQFGKVIMQGNAKLPFSAVQQELDFVEGQAWSRKKLDTTMLRLRDLDVFDTVSLYPAQTIDKYLKKQDLYLYVEQARPYEARVRMGAQYTGGMRKAVTYKAGGNLIVRNPLGWADRFEMGADATLFYRNLFAQYHMPLLFSGPVRSLVRVYDNHYDQPVYLGSRVPLYKAGQQGFLFSVQRKFETINYGITLGLEALSLQGQIQDFAQVLDYDQELLDKKLIYIYAEPGILIDKRNHLVNPTRGSFSLATCKAMIDAATGASFFRCTAEHTHYVPVADRFTFAGRIRVGRVFKRSIGKVHPIERFYLGGPHSVRSYIKDYAPPLGRLVHPLENVAKVPESGHGLWAYVPQGARSMVNMNLEIRACLYKNIDLVLFHDMGALWKDSWNALQDHLVMGTGFGLRYQTPIGPLRFDIAWKWKRMYDDFEMPYSWFISLGHAF